MNDHRHPEGRHDPTGPEQEPTPERDPKPDEPRIYVASLSDYNDGILHGDWLTATSDAEQLHESIAEMLATSPIARRTGQPAEEWAIHDYEGFGLLHLSEHESIERVTRLGRGIAEHGPAFAAWADLTSGDDEALDRFEDGYWGHHESRTAWGQDLLDEHGIDRALDEAVPGFIRHHVHVDIDGLVRDMEASGGLAIVDAVGGGVYVFDVAC